MAFYHFHGQKIAYQLHESDKEPDENRSDKVETLVFLHGLGADQRQAINTASNFGDFQLLTIDMPGHGETVIAQDEDLSYWYRFDTFCNIVLSLLNHLKIFKAILGGISMGAAISIQVALKQPERVNRLLLVRPAWLNKAAIPHLSAVKTIGEDILRFGIEQTEKRLIGQAWFQALKINNPLSAKSIAGLLTRPQALHGATVLKNLVLDAPFKQLVSLKKIHQPTLIFSNDEDLLHPSSIAEQLAELIPNAHCLKLPSRYQMPEEHQHQLIQLTQLFLMSAFKKHKKEFI